MGKRTELRAEEYVLSADGSPVPLSDLPPEEYLRFCRWLNRKWLGAVFAGRAEFPEEEDRDLSSCARQIEK